MMVAYLAGITSGLLGVGGGVLKVSAMNPGRAAFEGLDRKQRRRLPFADRGMILSNILFAVGIALALLHPGYPPVTAPGSKRNTGGRPSRMD